MTKVFSRCIRCLMAMVAFSALPALADEQVTVCYGYGCAGEQDVVFSERRLVWVADVLALADSAERERALLSLVMGRLYAWAGEQSPIATDRGGNFADEGQPGSMDCIDHSTTSTRFLALLERRGALNFHRVLEPAMRGTLWPHLSAQIEEIGPELMYAETENIRRFAVDSWYVDNGQPAVVLPLEDWMDGAGPDV